MFKVLDVRESISLENSIYSQVVIIATEIGSAIRRRFVFNPPKFDRALSTVTYWGYTGDWNVLIPGDYFIIEKTDSWKNVRIICEEDINNESHS